ncbi:MAG TPA: ABC transporter ATP-binding protein, partial [Wenzhouxiangellaceae bacterium]|nr:ABC transporter ATP-binding protein [Wenzhouxiangellaceae bacterium]
ENTTVKALLGKLDIETFVLDLCDPLEKPPEIEGIEIAMRDPTTLLASLPKSQSLNVLFRVLEQRGIEVKSMRNKVNRLEELFLRLVEKPEKAA